MKVRIRGRSFVLLSVFLLVTLLFPVNGSVMNVYYSLTSPISAEAPKVILQSGTAGTSTIYTNSTSAKVSVTDVEDYVDNNTSDVDGSADKGTRSNFTAQQYGPDLINDTLTEANTGGGEGSFGLDDNTGTTKKGWAADNKVAYKFTLSEDGDVWGMSFYGKTGGGATAPYVFKGIIYDDSGGAPNNLKGTTEEITFSATEQWYSGNFSSAVSLSSGTYWLGIITGSKFDLFRKLGNTNQEASNADTYSDGTSDPFGSPTYDAYVAAVYANYTRINYELDLEVQWTSADFDETSEELCIYGGTMGAENIRVDVWNGSGWESLLTDLNSGWNNVSVTSYLASSTFTIRFKGGTETSDTTQDTWNIDATLLHVWNGDGSGNFNYVLKMTENNGSNWKVRLNAYDQSNIARLDNCSIYIYDGSNSTQVVILNGAFNQQTGSWYDLVASDIEYIWMHVETSSAGTSYVYAYLEILVPNTTTYAQYIITFEIT